MRISAPVVELVNLYVHSKPLNFKLEMVRGCLTSVKLYVKVVAPVVLPALLEQSL